MTITRTEPSWTLVPSEQTVPKGVDSWDRSDWQRVWLRTQSTDWRMLALVPGDDQTSTLDVANVIARLALDHGESIRVADARALRPKHVDDFLEGSRWEASQGTRIVFATRPASSNIATVPIARAADCAILCASLGSTSLKGIRSTIEEIGRDHFLGSLLVQASKKGKPRRLKPRHA
ncbi:MAG TPA: hypothetical protein VGL81_34340 [Polyangiaceae bacterium]|jgi:hypothetical protein